jgi:glycosyltransferase involved in cell wall biosynthesis
MPADLSHKAIDRSFVLHRNDGGIPAARKIKVFKPASRFSDKPEISIIIPTVDGHREGYLPALLKQLREQSFQNFEIIIIEGDPRQGRAINTGAGIAEGKFLLTLDDDTRLMSREALAKLLRVLKNDETVGMAGGINIVPPEAQGFIRRVMQEIPRRSMPPVNEITESDLAEHPLLLIRKDIFFTVGGENELIPRGLDPYLRMKFRRAGYKIVVVPQAYYSHLPPPTYAKLVRQFFRNGKQAAYCNKFYPRWVLETPDRHVGSFVEKRSFGFRCVRYAQNMLLRLIKGHWIYISVYIAYALGFCWGYVRLQDAGAE